MFFIYLIQGQTSKLPLLSNYIYHVLVAVNSYNLTLSIIKY